MVGGVAPATLTAAGQRCQAPDSFGIYRHTRDKSELDGGEVVSCHGCLRGGNGRGGDAAVGGYAHVEAFGAAGGSGVGLGEPRCSRRLG